VAGNLLYLTKKDSNLALVADVFLAQFAHAVSTVLKVPYNDNIDQKKFSQINIGTWVLPVANAVPNAKDFKASKSNN